MEGTRAPSVQTTPKYTDEMDIEEIIERSRDFKCKLLGVY